jgi:hypothetical protein
MEYHIRQTFTQVSTSFTSAYFGLCDWPSLVVRHNFDKNLGRFARPPKNVLCEIDPSLKTAIEVEELKEVHTLRAHYKPRSLSPKICMRSYYLISLGKESEAKGNKECVDEEPAFANIDENTYEITDSRLENDILPILLILRCISCYVYRSRSIFVSNFNWTNQCIQLWDSCSLDSL